MMDVTAFELSEDGKGLRAHLKRTDGTVILNSKVAWAKWFFDMIEKAIDINDAHVLSILAKKEIGV